MSKRIGYMFQSKQLTLVLDGRPYEVGTSHIRYKDIIKLLSAPEGETPEGESSRLLALTGFLCEEEKKYEKLEVEIRSKIGIEDVHIKNGNVHIKGVAIHNSLTQRILELKEAGLPFAPFINFLVNLEQNPSAESRENLFNFLEQGRFPLTDDGCFLGYKGVVVGNLKETNENGVVVLKETLVDNHSRSFEMTPGKVHTMPWDEVDDNSSEACGAGFHVGTIGHARGFGGVMILVKVNPKDCVSVPLYDKTKLRCCSYEVVNIYQEQRKAQELVLPAYTAEQYKDYSFEEAEEIRKKEIQAQKEEEDAVTREELMTQSRDDLCRQAARQGICASTNEARELGKELVVEALLLEALPLSLMTRDQVIALAVRRRLFPSENAAKKSGRANVEEALNESTKLLKSELTK